MFKLGTLIAIATTSSSAMASPYAVSYANININHKEYSAVRFPTDILPYLDFKYPDDFLTSSLHHRTISNLLARTGEHHSQEFQDAIENKVEAAYLNDPFNDSSNPFDPSEDMILNIANVITNWLDANPTWEEENSTDPLVAAINAIPVGSTGETFNFIESQFNTWITDIQKWGVNQNSFNQIESSMQMVVDANANNGDDYYMDINDFYTDTSSLIMDGQDFNAIETNVIDTLNNESSIWNTRIAELQFNIVENEGAYEDIRAAQEIRLINIVDHFDTNRNIEETANSLNGEDLQVYEGFVNGLVSELSMSMDSLIPLDKIADSNVNTSSTDMYRFFQASYVDEFLDNYKGIEVNIDSVALDGENAEMTLQVIDSRDAIIVEKTFETEYESDVLRVENILETITWQFTNKDEQHLVEEGIDDNNVSLTSNQLDMLFLDYIVQVEDQYQLVTVDATWELIDNPNTNAYDFVITFDISKGAVHAQVVRTHTIAKFDDQLDSTLAEIIEQLQFVSISELLIKMNGHSSDVDILDPNDQLTYINTQIHISSPVVEFSVFRIVYDSSAEYPTNVTQVSISIVNTRTGDMLNNQNVQVKFVPALEDAFTLLTNATYYNLYKDYVNQWHAGVIDVKDIIVFEWDSLPELEWVYNNMLDNITIDNNIPSSDGIVNVDLRIGLSNNDNGSSLSRTIERESSRYNLPIDEADASFSSYVFNDPTIIGDQLGNIVDQDNPTVAEMDHMIRDFESIYQRYLNFELDGPYSITTYIGAIQDVDEAPFNELLLTDINGNTREVLIQYDTNLVSGEDVVNYRNELIEHASKINYILSELSNVENIPLENHIAAQTSIAFIITSYDATAKTTDKDDWEEYKKTQLTAVYYIFSEAWSGEGTVTAGIIEEINEDYPNGVPSSIQTRITEYIGGITIMPIPLDVDDIEGLDEVVDIILSLTKEAFLIDEIEIDIAGKLMIFVSGITLGLVSVMALISTIRIIITHNKIKKIKGSTINYSSPKKLVAFSAISSIIAATSSVTLMIYIFVTKGGL